MVDIFTGFIALVVPFNLWLSADCDPHMGRASFEMDLIWDIELDVECANGDRCVAKGIHVFVKRDKYSFPALIGSCPILKEIK
jgi:hypothetical protein